MINKLPFVLWFVLGYITSLMIIMLIAVYGYGARAGMEMQLYSAMFAVKLFSIMILISAVVVGAGFFAGVILSGCRRGKWLGIVLGGGYGILALFLKPYTREISIFLGLHSYDLAWVLGFLGGLMLPVFVWAYEESSG